MKLSAQNNFLILFTDIEHLHRVSSLNITEGCAQGGLRKIMYTSPKCRKKHPFVLEQQFHKYTRRFLICCSLSRKYI